MKRIRKSIFIIPITVMLAACGIATPMRVETVTATPNLLPLTPSISSSPTYTTIPSPTNTLVPTSAFTSIPTSTTADKIRLYHNEISSRTIRDKFSFSVIVIDKDADFVPKSIEIIEKGTNLIMGQYKLFNETEMKSLCSKIRQHPNFVFYETVLIDYSELPQGFIARTYEGDYIFRITIEYLSGGQEVVEISVPQDRCYSAVQ